MRMKRNIVAAFTLSVLMVSGMGILLITSSNTSVKSIMVSPVQESIPAQYEPHAPIEVRSNADFAALGASGVGTRSDPYIFDNLEISNAETCIEIQDTTAYFLILNCKVSSADLDPAIRLRNVENGRVEQCEIAGGSSGLEFNGALDSSASGNAFYGCWNGILMFNSENCTVYDNEIHNNQYGVKLEWTEWCEITNNSIYSNDEFGIEVAFYSYNNSFYGNSIGWNYLSGGDEENAIDNGEDNRFDDGISLGNLWSDYTVAEPYQVPGLAGVTDEFAGLLVDDTAPAIVPQYDTAIDAESIDNTLTWLVGDEFPATYMIEENEYLATTGIWSGEEITISLDHLEVGTYELTITIYDGADNSATDVVFVSVISFLLGGIGTELVMIASGITVLSFAIIIILIKKLS